MITKSTIYIVLVGKEIANAHHTKQGAENTIENAKKKFPTLTSAEFSIAETSYYVEAESEDESPLHLHPMSKGDDADDSRR